MVENRNEEKNIPDQPQQLQNVQKKQQYLSFMEKPVSIESLKNASAEITSQVEKRLMTQENLGAASAGGVIAGAQMTGAVFKGAQAATEAGISVTKAGVNTGKAAVSEVKAAVAIGKSYKLAKGKNVMPVSKAGLQILHQTFVQYGVTQTHIAKSIQTGITAAQKVMSTPHMAKKGVATVSSAVIYTAKGVKKAAQMAVNTIKGLKSGAVSFSSVVYRIEMFAKAKTAKLLSKGAQASKTAARGALRGTIKGTKFIVPKAVKVGKFGIRTGRGGVLTVASAAGSSDNYAMKGLSYSIKTADAAARVGAAGIKTGAKIGSGVGKAGIKTVKTGVKAAQTFWQSYTRTNSIRKAMGAVGKKGVKRLGQMLKQAGGSMVNALLSLAKTAIRKVAVPLLLIVAVAGGGVTVISAPVTAVASIFSGIFTVLSDDGTQTDWLVEDYLVSRIPSMTADTKNEVVSSMETSSKAGGGNYDIIRLADSDGISYVTADRTGVDGVFYTDDEIVTILAPIFNTIILMNYELNPNDSEAEAVLTSLYNQIFSWEAAESTEYCGQNLKDGTGTPELCADTSQYHAITAGENACPDYSTGTHDSYTDSHCDATYYVCQGHAGSTSCGFSEEHVHSGCRQVTAGIWDCGKTAHKHVAWRNAWTPSCYGTTYHSGDVNDTCLSYNCGNASETLVCAGYAYCNGHSVLTYQFSLDGIYGILQEIFYDPIEEIEAIPEADRTDEQKKQLSSLYENLEIYNAMATEVFYGSYGGGMTMADLSNVHFISGERTGNQDVIDLALSQVGQVGGQPYWSYFGFTERVSWCACFVHWCMRNTPTASAAWYETGNNAYCQTIADYYYNAGQFGHDASIITTGDLIFFDWTIDGHTDHIGMIIGTDGEKIYTVEGNSGDQVKLKSYDINASVIYGFGYMNY